MGYLFSGISGLVAHNGRHKADAETPILVTGALGRESGNQLGPPPPNPVTFLVKSFFGVTFKSLWGDPENYVAPIGAFFCTSVSPINGY